jgi:phosphoglycolate phosphatase
VDLLVLWDVDYTLVGADGLGTRLYEVVFREMFGRELTEVAPKAGRTDRAIIGDTLALAGVPASAAGPFRAALERAAADGAVPGLVRPLPGAAEAIAALASAGIRQSVLTGNVRPLAEEKLRRAGLGEHLDLDAGAYGDVHEVRAELVAVARHAAGRAYGARAVAVATGSYPAADLAAAGAHVVLPDLTDTARVVAAVTAGRAGDVTRSVDTGGRRPGPGRSSGASSSAGRGVPRWRNAGPPPRGGRGRY